MSCVKCGCAGPQNCGCVSTSVPLPPPCAQGTPTCPDPDPCSETFSSACVIYKGDDIQCLDIHLNTPVEDAIENIAKAVSVLTCPTCTYIIDLVQTVTPAPTVTIDINGTVYSLGAYGNVANWGQILINLNSLNLGTWSYSVDGYIITLVVNGSSEYNILTVLQSPNVAVTPTCVTPSVPPCEECFYSSQVSMTAAEMRVAIADIDGNAGKVFPITIPSGSIIEVVSASFKYTLVGTQYDTPSSDRISLIHNLASSVGAPQAVNNAGSIFDDVGTFSRFVILETSKLQLVTDEAIWLSFEPLTGPEQALGTISAYMMYRFITP